MPSEASELRMGARNKKFYLKMKRTNVYKILDMKRKNSGEFLTEEFLHIHPFNGFLARESGLVFNLRFFGNFDAGKREEQRDYASDKAHMGDYIWSIVRILFPSTGGNLTTTSSAKGNFGRMILNGGDIANLINYTTSVRLIKSEIDEILSEKEILIKTLGRKDPSILLIDEKIFSRRLLLKSTKENMRSYCEDMDVLLDHIFNGLTNQRKNEFTLGYPKYTIEILLLGFLNFHFNSIEENNNYYDNLDLAYFSESENEELQSIRSLFRNYASIRWSTPYAKSVDSLINNGSAMVYNRQKNEFIQDVEFADCAETALRHLITLVLWDAEGQIIRRTGIESVDAFFGGIDDPNDGSLSTRSLWNSIVGDLSSGSEDFQIDYEKDFEGNKYDLDGEMINYALVLMVVFNILTPKRRATLKDLKLKFSGNKLEALYVEILTEISGTKDIHAGFKVREGYHFRGKYFGTMTIYVNDIAIHLCGNMHGEISKVEHPEEGFVDNGRVALKLLVVNFPLIKYVFDVNATKEDFFYMFTEKIQDNLEIIKFVAKVTRHTQEKLKIPLRNALNAFNWYDINMFNMFEFKLHELLEDNFYRDSIIGSVKRFRIFSPEKLEVYKTLKNLEYLDIWGAESFGTIDLNYLEKLKSINLSGELTIETLIMGKRNMYIKTIDLSVKVLNIDFDLSECSSLTKFTYRTGYTPDSFRVIFGPKNREIRKLILETPVDMSFFPNLRDLQIVRSSEILKDLYLKCPLLERLTLANIHINSLDIDIPNLNYLSLSNCKFTSLHIGSFTNLGDIMIEVSRINTLDIFPRDHIQLRCLDIRGDINNCIDVLNLEGLDIYTFSYTFLKKINMSGVKYRFNASWSAQDTSVITDYENNKPRNVIVETNDEDFSSTQRFAEDLDSLEIIDIEDNDFRVGDNYNSIYINNFRGNLTITGQVKICRVENFGRPDSLNTLSITNAEIIEIRNMVDTQVLLSGSVYIENFSGTCKCNKDLKYLSITKSPNIEKIIITSRVTELLDFDLRGFKKLVEFTVGFEVKLGRVTVDSTCSSLKTFYVGGHIEALSMDMTKIITIKHVNVTYVKHLELLSLGNNNKFLKVMNILCQNFRDIKVPKYLSKIMNIRIKFSTSKLTLTPAPEDHLKLLSSGGLPMAMVTVSHHRDFLDVLSPEGRAFNNRESCEFLVFSDRETQSLKIFYHDDQKD